MIIRKFIKRLTALTLLAAVCAGMAACGSSGSGSGPKLASVNLMEGIASKQNNDPGAPSEESAKKAEEFAVRFFKTCIGDEDENVLVSPLSVLSVLSMTANGAGGNTRSQMEDVLGMSCGELNEFYRSYRAQLPRGEKYKLNIANSIWLTDEDWFKPNKTFLQTNADYYGAEIYKTHFDDSTVRDVNNWVNAGTDGMIPSIISEFPSGTTLCLINALTFDAEWEEIYEDNRVVLKTFMLEDGTEKDALLMYSQEGEYLEGEGCVGFKKYYKDGKYAFAALLPNKGVSVKELVASLDGAKLYDILRSPQMIAVNAAIPKFDVEYSTELSGMLEKLGMTDAFDAGLADFSGIGDALADGNTSISRVMHKTFIQVDEKGTRAGAVSAVEMPTDCGPEIEFKTVYLDRPFIYMLIDCETDLPFFIGTMMDIEG